MSLIINISGFLTGIVSILSGTYKPEDEISKLEDKFLEDINFDSTLSNDRINLMKDNQNRNSDLHAAFGKYKSKEELVG